MGAPTITVATEVLAEIQTVREQDQARARRRARDKRENTAVTPPYPVIHRRSTSQRASRDQDSCAKRRVVQFLETGKKAGPIPRGRRLLAPRIVYHRSTGPNVRRRDLFVDGTDAAPTVKLHVASLRLS